MANYKYVIFEHPGSIGGDLWRGVIFDEGGLIKSIIEDESADNLLEMMLPQILPEDFIKAVNADRSIKKKKQI